MAKMLYRKDTGEILGVHIIGLHAADLIHEASNAIATKQKVQVRAATGAGHGGTGSGQGTSGAQRGVVCRCGRARRRRKVYCT